MQSLNESKRPFVVIGVKQSSPPSSTKRLKTGELSINAVGIDILNREVSCDSSTSLIPVNPIPCRKNPASLSSIIDFTRYSKILDKLHDPCQQIEISNGRIILIKDGSQDLLNDENIDLILEFLKPFPSEFHARQQDNLDRLKNKLIGFVKDAQLQHYVNNQFAQLGVRRTLSKFSVNLQVMVASPPANSHEFLNNVALYNKHYPCYQFDNEAGLFDAGYSSPRKLHPVKVFETVSSHVNSLDENLQVEMEGLLNAIKPKKIVKMGLIVDHSEAVGRTFFDLAKSFVDQEIPLLASKNLFCSKLFFDLLDHGDVYLQSPGGFILILPKGEQLEGLGFSSACLTRWHSSEGTPIIPEKCELAQDLDLLLLNEQKNISFYRLISLTGHGFSPLGNFSEIGPLIVGVSPSEFQAAFDVMETKNTKSLELTSCYFGGELVSTITGRDLSFPVIINNASEIPSLSHFRLRRNEFILDEFADAFFKIKSDFFVLKEFSIRRNQLKKVVGKRSCIFSIPSIFLPSFNTGIPLSPFTSKSLFDTHEKFARAKRQQLNTNELVEINDTNRDKEIYLFSDQILPVKLNADGNKKIALISRGGNACHVLAELTIRSQLTDLVYETFNVYRKKRWPAKADCEFANKAFAFGKVNCFSNTESSFENVFIANLSYSNISSKRHLIYRIKGEETFTCVNFKLTNEQGLWEIEDTHSMDQVNAVASIYHGLICSSPNGNEELDFYEGLNKYFWNNNPPVEAEFFASIFCSRKIFERKTGDDRVSVKDVGVKHFGHFFERLREIKDQNTLKYAVHLIQSYINRKKIANNLAPAEFRRLNYIWSCIKKHYENNLNVGTADRF